MQSDELEPKRELHSFAQAAQELLSLLDGEALALARVVPELSGWSALAHVGHVSLANELVIKNLTALRKGEGLLVMRDATPNPEALQILASGQLPSGAASPRMVRPPADLDHATTLSWAAGVVQLIQPFAEQTDPGALQRLWIPHQILGPLTFAQWARFGAMHTRHHHALALRVLTAKAS